MAQLKRKIHWILDTTENHWRLVSILRFHLEKLVKSDPLHKWERPPSWVLPLATHSQSGARAGPYYVPKGMKRWRNALPACFEIQTGSKTYLYRLWVRDRKQTALWDFSVSNACSFWLGRSSQGQRAGHCPSTWAPVVDSWSVPAPDHCKNFTMHPQNKLLMLPTNSLGSWSPWGAMIWTISSISPMLMQTCLASLTMGICSSGMPVH